MDGRREHRASRRWRMASPHCRALPAAPAVRPDARRDPLASIRPRSARAAGRAHTIAIASPYE
ncbi:MAG: hypothetical protein AVDCRST_MAG40-1707 [uncultured Gemmatimonadaceae bacterium]|uniref:Uncharacterized protein n=1 Tax=uncultured Gemmatimonadaceae bacterium TaxID=246130 RepID=A0A6J4L9T0_9BACT|nr:MAG: hypothetical protein AVDCRST_MAG40-1707 [uncultured Gemmatimonadaceae bacterium]